MKNFIACCENKRKSFFGKVIKYYHSDDRGYCGKDRKGSYPGIEQVSHSKKCKDTADECQQFI